jgi:hypothetical protein
MNRLTFLSFGGGQDSTDILYRLASDRVFYSKYVVGDLVVVMSNTGDEHPATLDHVNFIANFCKSKGIEFYFLTSDQGYHPKTWPGLIEFMKGKNAIMSKAYPKTCTDNLKIKPLYNFLDQYIGRKYYSQDVLPKISQKRFIKQFAAERGRIRVLLGIAKGEERRVSGSFPAKWMTNSLERVYPLIAEGVDRQGAQDNITAMGLPLPPPSNCMRCPFMSEIELVWLFRFYPAKYSEWVDMEKNKVKKWERLGIDPERNLGVNGRKMLPTVLDSALKNYGHWTDEQLQEYKMSHGHCVKSKF